MNWIYFAAGLMIGMLIVAGWVAILTLTNFGFSRMRDYVYAREEYAEFRKMPIPPDQGIEQLIYKPEGTPAVINRNAFGRRNQHKL